jgi:hypothetical protein
MDEALLHGHLCRHVPCRRVSRVQVRGWPSGHRPLMTHEHEDLTNQQPRPHGPHSSRDEATEPSFIRLTSHCPCLLLCQPSKP